MGKWFSLAIFWADALVGALLMLCADEYRNAAVQRSACGGFCGAAGVRDALCVCADGRWKVLP